MNRYVKLNLDANCFLPAESKDCVIWVEKYVCQKRGTICSQWNGTKSPRGKVVGD